MRSRLLAALAATLLAGGVSLAGSTAQALPYTGTIYLALGTLPPVQFNGSGTGDPSLPSISANSFLGAGSSPVTGVAPITQIFLSVAGNASGTVGSGPTITASLQARGFGFGIPLVGAPLGGLLGFASATLAPVHSGGSGSVSAHFGAWTTGVATVARTHTLGTAGCAATANSPNCPTGMLGGATANANFFGGLAQIVLVAPTDLYTTTGGIGGIPTFTALALNYVPEPAEMLLLGSGALAMLVMGRRRPRG